MPEALLPVDDYLATLRREGEIFADSVGRMPLDAIVPTCPEWTMRELAQHVGRVHRWATVHVRDARPDPITEAEMESIWGPMPADDALDEWLRDGHARLVRTLSDAPSSLECWTFLDAPSSRTFWARRQAHETTVHRVDAQRAVGDAIDPIGTTFAVDGVNEVLLGFFGGRSQRLRTHEGEAPVTLGVGAADAAASWLVQIGPEGQASRRTDADAIVADCVIRGPAQALYLAMWNRLPPTAFELTGDAGVLDLWQQRARVFW